MNFIRKNIYMIIVAVLMTVFTATLALLPIRPTSNPTEYTLSEASASISELVSAVESDNYECPFPDVESIIVNAQHPPRVSGERTQLFVERALPIIRQQANVRDRIITAAELAIKCRVFFGSCGRSAGAIYALAGVSDADDIAPQVGSPNCMFSNDGCNLDIRKRTVPGTDEGMYLRGSLAESIIGRNCSAPPSARRSGCVEGGPAAKQLVKQEISSSLQNYPNRWSDHLEPGDWLYIYNGNSTAIGSHSIIFLGWENEAQGQAWIYEGNPRSWLGNNHMPVSERLAETRVRLNRACLKSNCGNYYPIVQVYDPDSAELTN